MTSGIVGIPVAYELAFSVKTPAMSAGLSVIKALEDDFKRKHVS